MIATDRLILRPETLDDFDAVAALWADPDLVRFIGGAPRTAQDSWERILRYAGHWALFGYGLFAVVDRASGRLIGEVGLAHFHRELGEDFDGCPEGAWVMDPTMHGRGLALEAMAAAQHWFDCEQGRQRCVCIIAPKNTRSLRLAEKLGYTRFATRQFRGEPIILLERVP